MGMLGCAHTARLQRACELSLGGGVCGLICLPSMGEEALGSRLTNAPDMGLNRRQGLQPGLCRGLRSASSFSFLLSVSLSLPALLQLPGACSRTCWGLDGLGGGGGTPWPPRLLPPPPPCSGSAAGAAACRALWRAPAGSSGTP